MGVVVANIRRGRSGRRLLAVRTNERAAAALGISVPGTKVYAFALSAGIAAVGGTLLAFRTDVVIYGNVFPNFNSILSVAYAFIGGIGYLFGPMNGSTLAPGSLGANISDSIFGGIGEWVPLIGGVILILLVLQNQNGIAGEQIRLLPLIRQRGKTMLLSLIVGFAAFFVLKDALDVTTGQGWLLFLVCVPVFVGLVTKFLTKPVEPVLEAAIAKLKPLSPIVAARGSALPTLPAATEVRDRVPPRTLELEDVTVRYGGVVAVDDVSFSVTPGTILGLIGPNGAGKTSVIDAVTGFTRASGSVRLDGKELMGLPPAKRARAGVSRSFQSLELFEDATVFDNLRAASDPRDKLSFLRDLVYPASPPLPSSVVAAIREFGLEARPRPEGARPPVRATTSAGDRPSHRLPAQRAAPRRAGGGPRRRRNRRARAPRAPTCRRLGLRRAPHRARHELRDERLRSHRRLGLRPPDRRGHARGGPEQSGRGGRLSR